MVQVSYEIALLITLDTTFRAENVAQAAFYTFFGICFWPLGTPSTGPVLAGVTRFGNDTTDVQVFPGYFAL